MQPVQCDFASIQTGDLRTLLIVLQSYDSEEISKMLIFSVFSISLKEMEKTKKLRETFYLKIIKKWRKGESVFNLKREFLILKENSHHNNAVLSDCAKPGDLGGYGGVGVTYHDGANMHWLADPIAKWSPSSSAPPSSQVEVTTLLHAHSMPSLKSASPPSGSSPVFNLICSHTF